MKRRKMSRKGSKKLFAKAAVRVHGKNNLSPVRGGIRF